MLPMLAIAIPIVAGCLSLSLLTGIRAGQHWESWRGLAYALQSALFGVLAIVFTIAAIQVVLQ